MKSIDEENEELTNSSEHAINLDENKNQDDEQPSDEQTADEEDVPEDRINPNDPDDLSEIRVDDDVNEPDPEIDPDEH